MFFSVCNMLMSYDISLNILKFHCVNNNNITIWPYSIYSYNSNDFQDPKINR